ncbi:flagellar type III secretion system pore protein FliP [Carboxydocella sp. ULO1]|uniref:flagellar type III secretion system pore protein FliP n=1 Tax=Carboxydocella sp. ULO1 TaxID=1926599 RepID=UPI0009AECF1A|nr:flagellar type III secretion system pore protein FliP [Carboxydocella sp. ULO1]AVX31176.1 flagellar biosynthetic protein FliP [Carboxydocella thermautotrophica]GAW28286.1 flagellar biosynthetic protein FliP [Carboxydocella sp. ULO1]
MSLLMTPLLAVSGTIIPGIKLGVETTGQNGDLSSSLQILLVLTILSLAPALLILMTSFTRIVVVLGFLRQALATQQMPPNQVIIGLALFLTFFTMAPTFNQVNKNALQPYFAGKITQQEALTKAIDPIREFMLKQTREKDLALFIRLHKLEKPRTYRDIPTYVIIPAFVISELKTAFEMGFLLFIPFIVIDMIVASALMSMGMMMLPPMMISLPFKLLLFVLVDGWDLVVQSLILSFR